MYLLFKITAKTRSFIRRKTRIPSKWKNQKKIITDSLRKSHYPRSKNETAARAIKTLSCPIRIEKNGHPAPNFLSFENLVLCSYLERLFVPVQSRNLPTKLPVTNLPLDVECFIVYHWTVISRLIEWGKKHVSPICFRFQATPADSKHSQIQLTQKKQIAGARYQNLKQLSRRMKFTSSNRICKRPFVRDFRTDMTLLKSIENMPPALNIISYVRTWSAKILNCRYRDNL